jgi:hypothetical protein
MISVIGVGERKNLKSEDELTFHGEKNKKNIAFLETTPLSTLKIIENEGHLFIITQLF